MGGRLIVMLIVLMFLVVLAPAEAAGGRGIVVNGTGLTVDVKGYDVAGRVLVPLRFVAEAFGARVTFNYQTGRAEIRYQEHLIEIPEKSLTYYANGRPGRLEWPAEIARGRMMVPTTLIDDIWDTSTYCDGRTGIIYIRSK